MAEYKPGDRVKVVKPGAKTFGKLGTVKAPASYQVLLDGEKTPRDYAEASLEPAPVTPPTVPTLVISGTGGTVQGADGKPVEFARAASLTAVASGYADQTAPGRYEGTIAEPFIDAYVNGVWLGRKPTTQPPAPLPVPPDPTPDPTPTPTGTTFGITMRTWQDNDRACWTTVKPKAGTPVRYETNTAGVIGWTDFYASLGATPQPLVSNGMWSDAQIDAFAAEIIKRKGQIKNVEYGNELSYWYDGKFGDQRSADYQAKARSYGAQAIRLARALKAAGIGVLIIWDDGGQGGDGWFDSVVTGIGGAANLKEFAGGTVHTYGPGGIGSLTRAIAQAKKFGWDTFQAYLTEDGISSDFGRTLSDNYGWPTNTTDVQAAQLLKAHHDQLDAIPQVKQILLYQSTDQAAHGASSGREDYFGMTDANGNPKGELTTYAQSRLS